MTKKSPTPLHGRRALQAEQTRQDILEAARRLFATRGYAATSLKDVAAAAGVSVQTLYDSIGNKAEIVRRLNDLIDAEADVGEIATRLETETDPRAVARIPAVFTRRLVERWDDIVRGALNGAQAEPALAAMVEEGGKRHRSGAVAVARRLAALGALTPDLTVDEAAITLAALSDVRVALMLIDDHHFDLDQVEDWIADTTERAVLV
ncbi:MAG TPA: TetR family transcriptional regulator [Acidimicrobiales bacterium]|nr:TetR family transcriptional regulator [Acidimicrobiales bacterium]